MIILSIIAFGISAFFSALVLRQYVAKRKPFQLFWGIGLAMFALAALVEAIALGNGNTWTAFTAKSYYLFGGMLLVGYLGLGSIHLLFGKTFAKVATLFMLAITVVGAIVIIPASIKVEELNAAIAAGSAWEWKEFVPVPARIIAAVTNILGSLFLIGGALYSGIMVLRKRQDRQRFIANSVIAAGALIVASGGTLGGLFGLGQEFISFGQAPGITVMFIGFLLASRPAPAPAVAATQPEGV